jgi:hypothetical protein
MGPNDMTPLVPTFVEAAYASQNLLALLRPRCTMAREGQHTNRNWAWALGSLLALCVCTAAAVDNTDNGAALSYRRRLLGDHKYKQNDPVPLYAAKVGDCRVYITCIYRSLGFVRSASEFLQLMLTSIAAAAICRLGRLPTPGTGEAVLTAATNQKVEKG